MRRKDREMDRVRALEVVDAAAYTTLATVRADGSPYCVPLSFVRNGNGIVLHGSCKGQKMDCFRRDDRVCLTFVGRVQVPPPMTPEEFSRMKAAGIGVRALVSNTFTTEYESAVAFGWIREITGPDEKRESLRCLCERYTPESMEWFQLAADASLAATCVLHVEMEQLTGKRKVIDNRETKSQ